jgi:hypothetical protein
LVDGDDPTRDARVVQFRCIIWFIIIPPSTHMRLRLPPQEQIKVFDCCRAKDVFVGGHHSETSDGGSILDLLRAALKYYLMFS